MTLLYLKALTFAFLVPGILIGIYLHRRNALPARAIVLTTILFAVLILPLDIYVTSRGVWSFSGEHVVGLWLFGLPLEEYLFFFIVIPFVMLLFLLVQRFVKYNK